MQDLGNSNLVHGLPDASAPGKKRRIVGNKIGNIILSAKYEDCIMYYTMLKCECILNK